MSNGESERRTRDSGIRMYGPVVIESTGGNPISRDKHNLDLFKARQGGWAFALFIVSASVAANYGLSLYSGEYAGSILTGLIVTAGWTGFVAFLSREKAKKP